MKLGDFRDRSQRSKIKITLPELPIVDASTDISKPVVEINVTNIDKKKSGGLLGLLPSPKFKVEKPIESSAPKPNLSKQSNSNDEQNPSKLEKISNFLPLKSKDRNTNEQNLGMSSTKSATKNVSLVAAYGSDSSSESSQDEKIYTDFFGLNCQFAPELVETNVEANVEIESEEPPSRTINQTDATMDYLIPSKDDEIATLSTIDTVPNQNVLDDESLKRLTGDRKRRQPIHYIDVNANQLKNQDIDTLKQLTQERETTYTGVSLGGESKRRHQITYLALQARQMETQLKNKWAKSRANRQQSRMKYGF